MGSVPGAGGSVHLDTGAEDRAGTADDRTRTTEWTGPRPGAEDTAGAHPGGAADHPDGAPGARADAPHGPTAPAGRPAAPPDVARGTARAHPEPAATPRGEPPVEHTGPAEPPPGRPGAYPTECAEHPRDPSARHGVTAEHDTEDAATRHHAPAARSHPTWDDGFIARRAPRPDTPAEARGGATVPPPAAADPTDRADRARHTDAEAPADAPPRPLPSVPPPAAPEGAPLTWPAHLAREFEPLRTRLDALRQLVLLTRSRLGGAVLAEADRVLAQAAARGRTASTSTVVALAGATGSGKSSLLNALAGAPLAEAGTRRPTTAEPLACVWPTEEDATGGPDDLLDRLGVAAAHRHRAPGADDTLAGLVLLDLPDHDSLAPDHRERVDRLLRLVDAVVWVVDPEKYADAVLHERYLRPLAGYGEVTFVVLNQVDRLPAGSADHVLHDLRRLLDEDGMPLGEHGDPGATVLAMSTLTGEGVEELRACLGALVAERAAPVRRLAADLDGAVARLQPVFVAPGVPSPVGLTEQAQEEFEDLLALAVGAGAVGQAAERRWLRRAERACGTPWVRWVAQGARRLRPGRGLSGPVAATAPADTSDGDAAETAPRVTRPVLAQAVRALADEAACGLPDAWARTVREAAWRGAEGLPEALEAEVRSVVDDTGSDRAGSDRAEADTATAEAAAVDDAAVDDAAVDDAASGGTAADDAAADAGVRDGRGSAVAGPRWWTVARLVQTLLGTVLVVGLTWGGLTLSGRYDLGLLPPLLLTVVGAAGGPALAAACRAAARGPAQAYGRQQEQRLRQRAVDCGRERVLAPVAAELARYREAREQYALAAGEQGLL